MIERILALLAQSGSSDYAIEKTLEFTQGTISNWRRGKNSVSTYAITKLAQHFNVSADYLLCLTDEPKPLKSRELKQVHYSVPAIVSEMPDLFKELRFVNAAKIYNELPDEYRERVFGFIIGVAAGLGINVERITGDRL